MRLSDGFDDWWDGLRDETKAGADKALLRRAYTAGFRKSSTPELKKFKFYAGKRPVSVNARTLSDAREKAKQELTKRAVAAGFSPPKSGWNLMLATSSQQA